MHLIVMTPNSTLPFILATPLFKHLQIIYNRKSSVILDNPTLDNDAKKKELTWNGSGLIQLPGRKQKQKEIVQDDIDESDYYQSKFSIRRVREIF
jgi:hypothetical protein